MKKRLTFILVSLGVLLALVGCNGKYSNETILEENIPNINVIESINTEVKEYDFKDANSINNYYVSEGLLEVTYSEGSTVFSFLAGKELFSPKENVQINFEYIGGLYYIVVEDLTKETTIVYDVWGNVIVPERVYEDWDVDIRLKYDFTDIYDLEIYYLEDVSVSYYDRNDKLINNKTTFELDKETSKRTKVDSRDGEYYFDSVDKINLSIFGLDGYYTKEFDSDTLYIYSEKTDKLANTVYFDDGEVVGAVNGKVIVQKIHRLNPYSKDFTYTENEKLYKHVISTVDLISGKEKTLKADYIIEDAYPLKNKKGKMDLVLLEIRKISSSLLHENTIFVVIDDKGKIVRNYGEMDISNLRALHNNYYIDVNSSILYNSNLEPLFEIDDYYKNYSNQELIGIGLYSNMGLIDFEGKIIVPFEHKHMGSLFVDGFVHAIDAFNDNLLYDTKGNKTVLEDNVSVIVDGLLMEVNDNDVKFMDYKFNVKLKVSNVEAIENEYSGNRLANDFKIFRLRNDDGTYRYVFVKSVEKYNN